MCDYAWFSEFYKRVLKSVTIFARNKLPKYEKFSNHFKTPYETVDWGQKQTHYATRSPSAKIPIHTP